MEWKFLNFIDRPAFVVADEFSPLVEVNQAFEKEFGRDMMKYSSQQLLTPKQKIQDTLYWIYHAKKYEIFRFELGTHLLFILKDPHSMLKLSPIEIGQKAASTLTHLFRSPLTAAMGFTELLEDSPGGNSSIVVRELKGSLQDISNYVDELDRFRKPLVVAKEAIHLSGLLRTIVAQLPIPSRKKIHLDIGDRPVVIQSDEYLVTLLLHLLIQNALEHHQSETEVIVISLKENHILRIQNTGEVISSEIAHQLFTPFVTTKAHGLGLGLARVKKIADHLEMDVFLEENSRQKGITFRVDF